MAGNPRASEAFPLISIRTPAYNHKKFVRQAFDSIIEDSYPNKELVVVDDGSSDGTDGEIRAWVERHGRDLPVRYVRRENNLGIVNTLNEVIDLCRGDYIVSLASDDYLLPDGIMKRYRYLQENPQKLAVFSDCLVVDGENCILFESGLTGLYKARIRNFVTDAGLRKEFISRWSVPGPVLMVDRQVFELVGKYREDIAVEDLDFYLRMAAKNLIGFLNEKVSAYRLHGGNICKNPGQRIRQLSSMKATLAFNRKSFSFREKILILKKLCYLSVHIQFCRGQELLGL